jgi:putative aldouronate transport system substrate-binding protein
MSKRNTSIAMALVMAMVTALSVWAGGSRSSASSAGPAINRSNFNALGTFPLVKNKETLTIMISQTSVNYNPLTNPFTKYYEDKTNVHINWIVVASDQYKERVNLALASGEQIDLILAGSIYSMSELQRLADQGLIMPVQDYVEQDTLNMKRRLPTVEGWREIITFPDGNIYTVPRLNECLHCAYYGKVWVNKEFLKNVGLSIPTTPEEFRQMLIAFKTKDANGNGDPNDEIPFSTSNSTNFAFKLDTYLMNAFVYDDGENRLYLDNGKVTAAFQQPEFQEGLRYLRQLYTEGLIYPGSFTQDENTKRQLNSQKYESVIGATLGSTHSVVGTGRDVTKGEPARFIEYEPIPPLKGPKGLQVARYDPFDKFELSSWAALVPATAKNPALVMRLLDYFFTDEGGVAVEYGVEGIGWYAPDAGATGIDGKPAVYKRPFWQPADAYYQNYSWGQIFPNFRDATIRSGQQVPFDYLAPDGSGVERLLHVYTEKNFVPYAPALSTIVPPLYYSEDVVSEIAVMTTNINTYVNESIAKFVTGSMDVERDWVAFQNNLKSLDIDRYLQIIQTTYNNSAFVKK